MKILIITILIVNILQSDFIRIESGLVIDTSKGLIWQDKVINSINSWEDTIDSTNFDSCHKSTLAGYTDWRLPNINELKTLIDYTKHAPAFDISIFTETERLEDHIFFLSSTTFHIDKTKVWSIDFYNGSIIPRNKVDTAFYRCVRNR